MCALLSACYQARPGQGSWGLGSHTQHAAPPLALPPTVLPGAILLMRSYSTSPAPQEAPKPAANPHADSHTTTATDGSGASGAKEAALADHQVGS